VNVGSSHDPSDHRSPPIALVGHCYGGAVITNAATGDLDVRARLHRRLRPRPGRDHRRARHCAARAPRSQAIPPPCSAGEVAQATALNEGFQAGLLLAAGIVVVAVVLSAAVSRGSLPAARRGPAAAIVTPDQA
jgi:hypothetical protein